MARILVTGLVLDPETRMTDYRTLYDGIVSAPGIVHSRFGTTSSTVALDANKIHENMADIPGDAHAYPPGKSRQASEVSGTSRWIGSKIGLEHHPFQLAIEKQQSLSEQNLPYLRHSWNRIDFVAVVSFWIMFGLALSGAEKMDNRHTYIFRALSVLRLTRLLAVTTGTTVSG